MQHHRPFVRPFLLALALGPLLPAQGPDPMKEIQEIARKVDEQLQEIDQLLLESGKKSQARSTQKELLQKAAERAETVDGGIDQLIEKLTKMKNQSGSGQSQDQKDQQQPQDGQSQPKPGQGQEGQQNRRENQTPDFVQQPKPGEQQGQEQGKPQPQGQKPDGQEPGGGQPQGGQEAKDQAENREGNHQLEPDIGPGQPGAGEGSWGELQPYVNFLKNRGSAPKVPEKYRKYWQAYLKNKQGGGSK